jgi:hypothetical protein
MILLMPTGAAVRADQANHQLCWTMGQFDATVYFAQAVVKEDRKESFNALLTISGIDHREVECVLRVDQRLLPDLIKSWSAQNLEVVNTTFLSDLDY